MAMSRDQMLRYLLVDIQKLRDENASCLLPVINNRARGYAGAMWHAGLIVECEFRRLIGLLDNAEMYAKRECKY